LAAAVGGVGSWLVIGDPEFGSELGRGLAHGTDRDTLRAALADVDNVLFAPESAGSLIDVASAYGLFNEARALVEDLVSMPSAPRSPLRGGRHEKGRIQRGGSKCVAHLLRGG
jgi:hypothetical protein